MTNKSESLFYDTAQRFIKYERGPIAGTPNFTQTYTLGHIGNWTSFNNTGSIESRSHSVTNELTAQGATALNYDLNGNSLNSKDHQYVWDELNRLIEVKTSSGVTIVTYFYDVHNLRVKKDFGTPEIMYYYCDGRVIEERDENDSLLREYIYRQQYIDEVLSVADHTGSSSTTYLYYLTDLRYSVYALIDNLGNIVERYKYNGCGERIVMNNTFNVQSSSSINQEYAYTGRRLDSETNLMYFRVRYFNTDQGRFINRDPLGYVDGMGLYNGYFVPFGLDPSGLIVCVGKARVLKGNDKTIGRPGGFDTPKKPKKVEAGTAAVDPAQWGGKGTLRPFIESISGTISNDSGETLASFSGITDVIGGESPIPGKNVRDALKELNPGVLIIELPSGKKD